jgi:hypothetical protein
MNCGGVGYLVKNTMMMLLGIGEGCGPWINGMDASGVEVSGLLKYAGKQYYCNGVITTLVLLCPLRAKEYAGENTM